MFPHGKKISREQFEKPFKICPAGGGKAGDVLHEYQSDLVNTRCKIEEICIHVKVGVCYTVRFEQLLLRSKHTTCVLEKIPVN